MAEACHHEEEHRDPVCGMKVKPDGPHFFAHAGETYRFCCNGCKEKFAKDPAKYLTPPEEREEEAAPPGTVYTCPMHPEIEQIGPGSCPKCGMALEPMSPGEVGEEDDSGAASTSPAASG